MTSADLAAPVPADFSVLGASGSVCDVLAERGIVSPTPVQDQVIPAALEGRDVLAQAPTGTGKTLAFGVPLAERLVAGEPGPTGLVLVPTRELARQVLDELMPVARARRLWLATATGGEPYGEQVRRIRRADIVVATPGRLMDLVERGATRLDRVSMLVLDEADRMLDMGFAPEIARIAALLPAERQTLCFSATLEGPAGATIERYVDDPVRVEVAQPTRDEAVVDHRFVTVEWATKLDALADELSVERGLAIVFVRTREGVDELADALYHRGFSPATLHGAMQQRARHGALARFSRGHADVLVATDVAARGLDVDGVTHVINFDPPHDDEGYVHRIGRTGRAGRTGTGVTLVLPSERLRIGRMAQRLGVEARCDRTGQPIMPPRSHDRGSSRRAPGPQARWRGRQSR